MAILLCDRELDLLVGLPSLAFRVYVQSLRPRMDLRTGYVGQKYRISYQAIKEDIFIEPGPGRVREVYSTDQLFRAARVLEKVGLVEIHSVGAAKLLIFKCIQAELINCDQNKPATNPRLEPATTEASIRKGLEGIRRDLQKHEPATHRRSESTVVHKSSSSTLLEPQDSKAETATALLRNEIKIEFWPAALTEQQREAIAAKLGCFPETKQQIVVDELAGFIAYGTKPISNPVRYIDFIIEKAKASEWRPELSWRIEQGRKNEQARAQRLAEPPKELAKGVPPSAEILANIQRFIGKRVAA